MVMSSTSTSKAHSGHNTTNKDTARTTRPTAGVSTEKDTIPQHDNDPHDPDSNRCSKDTNEPETILVPPSLRIAILAAAGVLRAAVGFQPHSGQDNYHGQRAAYGGDFEAQRHWMELTWHLPISQWYWYDLEYWGLDYPPLTAYVSWLCGALSHALVGPDSVALIASRGYEDPIHKAFMRGTVLILDLLLYGSAVLEWTGLGWWLPRPLGSGNNRTSRIAATTTTTVGQTWTAALALLQPAILLIDHGHFQYNTVALGLSLWAFYFMTVSSSSFQYCIWGSILFCLALCFKQITLYYAPAVFFYLLGRCFAKDHYTTNTITNTTRPAAFVVTKRLLQLAVTVIICFVTLCWPFVVWGPAGTNVRERITHVARRIFPLQRGLFEGKVSNLWCALSVRPLRLRQRIPMELQPFAALGLTFTLLGPVSYYMFRAGRWGTGLGTNGSTTSTGTILTLSQRQLLWGTTNSALAFFLASFQVHEKSLLLALAPCSLLLLDQPDFVAWFSIVTAWTMWPLMQIDRLQTAYVCTMSIFGSTLGLWRLWMTPNKVDEERVLFGTVHGFQARGGWHSSSIISRRSRWIPVLAYIVMSLLHVVEWQIPPRTGLPDLYPVLWSIVGCGFCCMAWLVSAWRLCEMDRHKVSTLLLQKKEKVS